MLPLVLLLLLFLLARPGPPSYCACSAPVLAAQKLVENLCKHCADVARFDGKISGAVHARREPGANPKNSLGVISAMLYPKEGAGKGQQQPQRERRKGRGRDEGAGAAQE